MPSGRAAYLPAWSSSRLPASGVYCVRALSYLDNTRTECLLPSLELKQSRSSLDTATGNGVACFVSPTTSIPPIGR
eukprot:scaffold102386_cov57-Phaeocystis_antarctica.AAC.1